MSSDAKTSAPITVLSTKTRRRIRDTKQLIEEAKGLSKGRLCKGQARVRDAEGNKVLGEDGKPLLRPCKRLAIKGGTVCPFHGGSAPNVKKSAGRRLLAMVEPSLVALEDLVDQNDHLPTKLGAIRTVLERAGTVNPIGALAKDTGERDTRPIINIGNITLGGLDMAKAGIQLNRELLPMAAEAEVIERDENDA